MMTLDNKQKLPWYREPYVWLLISFPLAAVIGGIFTIILAVQSDDGLVVDDYYKNGLAINRTLERDNMAKQNNLSATLQLEPNAPQFRLILQAAEGFKFPDRLQAQFLNASRNGFDQVVEVTRQEQANYTGPTPRLIRGKWHLLIETNDWRILQVFNIP